MGVKGLWKILQPAAETEAVAQLAMRAFEANTYRHRGYTIGIDVSIWFGHAKVFEGKPQCGRNPGLQMLFFRCARLTAIPILPLFVFDGTERPAYKRGKTRSYTDPEIKADAERIINAFGFACRDAPGEAEAELASLNSMGVIDAVWTDDGDGFLFGAETIIRNPSKTLSSNMHTENFDSSGQITSHVRVYKVADLLEGKIQLTRSGLILIALLCGGDYHEGVDGVGMATAHALARCGFGDALAKAVDSLEGDSLTQAISKWRLDVVQELRTNSRGQLGKRHPKLAASFPGDFPPLDIYQLYANPTVSSAGGLAISWYRAPDIARLADACEDLFTWGSQPEILQRFRSLVWKGAVCRSLRQRTLNEDGMGDFLDPATTDLETLVNQIHAERLHPSAHGLRELSVEVAPSQLADAVRRGTSSLRLPSAKYTRGKVRVAPDTALRVWLPASLIGAAMPELVRAFDSAQKAKQHDKGKKRQHSSSGGSSDGGTAHRKASRNAAQGSAASQRNRHPHHAAPANAIASSTASTSKSIIVISDSDDEVGTALPTRTRAAASATDTPIVQDAALASNVIVISSSDDE